MHGVPCISKATRILLTNQMANSDRSSRLYRARNELPFVLSNFYVDLIPLSFSHSDQPHIWMIPQLKPSIWRRFLSKNLHQPAKTYLSSSADIPTDLKLTSFLDHSVANLVWILNALYMTSILRISVCLGLLDFFQSLKTGDRYSKPEKNYSVWPWRSPRLL